MKYYIHEPAEVYAKLERQGLVSWDQLHGDCDYENFPSRPIWESFHQKYAKELRGAYVFEYGCGTGVLTNFLSDTVVSVDGFDLDPIAIKLAKKLCRKGNVQFSVLDFALPQVLNRSFDVVVDNFVTQNIVEECDRKTLFSNVYNNLKEEGLYALVAVICDDCDMDRIQYTERYGSRIPNRLHRTENNLINELVEAGFKCVESSKGDGQLHMVMRKSSRSL